IPEPEALSKRMLSSITDSLLSLSTQEASVSFIDYKELKTRTTIEDAAKRLGLELRVNANQLRGFCPACLSGGDRALAITPSKQLFYCFGGKVGGDCIALVAHIKGIQTKEAAHWLAGTGPASAGDRTKQSATPPPAPASQARAFDPEAYAARLECSHEALAGLALSPETFKAFKAGYAATGKLRGRLALPLTDRQGKTLCYVGKALKDEQPQLLYGTDTFNPHSILFGWDKAAGGDVLYVARDPLDVLRAHEGGITAVSFLGDITA